MEKDSPLRAIINPNSTRYSRVQTELLNPLSRITDNLSVTYTESPEYERNVTRIAEKIRSGEIILSCGGDGMSNLVANAVHLADKPDIRVIFLPFGNANDLALSLYGRAVKKFSFVRDLISMGRDYDLGMINVISNPGASRLAAAYACIGFSGNFSKTFCSTDYRHSKKSKRLPDDVTDTLTVVSTALSHRPFSYTEDGSGLSANEIMFINTRRMYKYVRANINHEDPHMLDVRLGPNLLVGRIAAKLVADMSRGGLKGSDAIETRLLITSPTSMHFDGEHQSVEEGTELRFSYLPEAIRTILPSSPRKS